MNFYKHKKPFVLIIFGASGDLAQLKLFPALYSLAEQGRFPKNFYIVGFARSKMTHQQFRNHLKKSIKNSSPKIINNLANHLYYFQGQYNKLEDFQNLRTYIKKLTKSSQTTKLAYFSVPPVVFKDIIENLGESKNAESEDLRLIIEKPFGEDTETARELFHFTARYFHEDCVFLLDHYLGKSAVQSILSIRHSNRLLNLMMKGPEIANIQISAFEKIGVSERAGYFDKVGTIKDMVQSHLLQILALITMSIPISEKHESLQREKNNILSALKFIESKQNIVLGQYDSYKQEKDIPQRTSTETFVATRLFIDRESWYRTPIYIRTGKKLHEKHTYIVVELKKFAFQPKDEEPNRLVFELFPNEKINIRLVNKHRSNDEDQSLSTSNSLACFGDDCLTEHALLILDVLRKRRINFLSFQEIIATWQITDSITNFVKRKKVKIESYKDGTYGPKSQEKLTQMDGFKWFDLH
ncbi:MAG: glucose-6-phosphate dehydrogenase [bacterium]|nr:glucose-6-phosphate dehydrogenase [bacterium]